MSEFRKKQLLNERQMDAEGELQSSYFSLNDNENRDFDDDDDDDDENDDDDEEFFQ